MFQVFLATSNECQFLISKRNLHLLTKVLVAYFRQYSIFMITGHEENPGIQSVFCRDGMDIEAFKLSKNATDIAKLSKTPNQFF
jgi:hypothetical protein